MKKVTTRSRTAMNSSTRKKNKVCICVPVPTNGLIHHQNSAFCAFNAAHLKTSIMTHPSNVAEDARTKLIKRFMVDDPSATHLFFLDADTVPINEYALNKLLSLDKPVVAGVTPIYLDSSRKFMWNVKKEGETKWIEPDELPDKPFKASVVGGTTILVRRDVIEKMKVPYQMTLRDKNTFAVTMSEDLFFCQYIHDLGYDIWIEPSVQCRHFHNVDLYEMMKLNY